MKDFECPYVSGHKGTISNWWAGVEPVCDILNKFLRRSAFIGYPYYNGVGYLFRKKVPRILFVFTNEFDNSSVKVYIRRAQAGSPVVTFNIASVVIPGCTKEKVYLNYLKYAWRQNSEDQIVE